MNRRLGGRLVVCSGTAPLDSTFESLIDASDSETETTYQNIPLENYWIGGDKLHAQKFGSALKTANSDSVLLIEESPRSVSLPFLLRAAQKREIPTVLWGHFSANSRPLGSTDIRDRFRINMANKATAVLTYTEALADELASFVERDRIFIAQNTLDTSTIFAIGDRLRTEGKAAVRERLGLRPGPIIAFIGRLIAEKGTAKLVDSVKALGKSDAQLVVIGDGPEKAAIQSAGIEAGLSVLMPGAIQDVNKSSPYLFASNVLLNPGYVGLSVVHAFALGLPVVAPGPREEFRFHSPEWVHIRSGHNGILTESEESDAFALAINDVLQNQDQYAANALRYAQESLSIDTMLDGIEAAIDFASSAYTPGNN